MSGALYASSLVQKDTATEAEGQRGMKKRKMGQSYYGIIRFPVRSYMLLQIYYNRSSRRPRRAQSTAAYGAREGQIKRKLLPRPPLCVRVKLANTRDIIISVSDLKFTIERALMWSNPNGDAALY